MKDITQLDRQGPRLARLGIWDKLPGLAGVTVEYVAHRIPERRFVGPLRDLISERSGHPFWFSCSHCTDGAAAGLDVDLRAILICGSPPGHPRL